MATLKSWIKRLLIYDPSDIVIRRGADAFPDEAPAFNAKEGVNDFSGVLDAMSKYCHVESLIFETHGAPGYVDFPNGGISSLNANQFQNVSSSVESGARVLFEGCNVGEGEAGRTFMLTVGKTLLLGKGGFVGAATSSNYGSLLEIVSLRDSVRMPPWGKLRIMQFGEDGSLITEQEQAGSFFSGL